MKLKNFEEMENSHISPFPFLIPLSSCTPVEVAELDFSKYSEKGAVFIFAAYLQARAIMNVTI